MTFGVLEATGWVGRDHDGSLPEASSNLDGVNKVHRPKVSLVPGTVQMYSTDDPTGHDFHPKSLDPTKKYDLAGPIPIVLEPQPTDDPNDPLNWPLWQRDCILVFLCILSIVSTCLSPILAPIPVMLTEQLGISLTTASLLTGWNLFAAGVAGFLFIPSARVWGKRHAYLIGNLLLIISCIWGGAVSYHYEAFLAARIFQGIGLAPFEGLVNSSVGDLFFVHERGKRMALSNMTLVGGAMMTPVISATIASNMGIKWLFYFEAIFCGVMFPFMIFFCPETAYVRDAKPKDTTSTTTEKASPSSPSTPGQVEAQVKYTIFPIRWMDHLRPFNGRKDSTALWKLVLRPFPLFLHPAVLWASIMQGSFIGWNVFIGAVVGYIMYIPPISFNTVEVGYVYGGAAVGALVGFILGCIIADSVPKLMARKNGGIYEPEFRLVLAIPTLIAGCIGMFGFAVSAGNPIRYGWFWPTFFFGWQICGMVLAAITASSYIADAYLYMTVESFTCLLIFKNVFSFGLMWRAFDWVLGSGVRKVFLWVASIQLFICLTTIPMYVFGKKLRALHHRFDLFKMLGLT